jgi:hypothetical protein
MTVKVNGSVLPGEFLTSGLDFFTIVTVVPCFPTNVKAPLSSVKAALNISATTNISTVGGYTVVDGTGTAVNYANDAQYSDALAKQSNLDSLLSVWSIRANPVVVNAYVIAGVENVGAVSFAGYSTAADLGSAYNSATRDLYTIKLVSERAGAWYVGAQGNFGTTANNTNEFGYQFLAALNGVAVTDLATPVVTGTDAFITSGDATNLNTIAVRDVDLVRQINAA